MTTYQRPLPRLDETNRFFWLAGEKGSLQILRCNTCGYWIHQPQPICSRCLSSDVGPQLVSGLGRIYTYSINVQPWGPGLEVPYTIASVELDEQKGLRVTTNIIGIEPDKVCIGMRVEVVFEHDEDVWLPFFKPVDH